MIRVIMTLFALVALGAGAAFFIDFVKQREQAEFTETNQRPSYVELPQMNVPIMRGGQVIEVRSFVFVIETVEGGPIERIRQNQAKLRNLYFTYLNAMANRAGPENIENIEYVCEQLKLASVDLVGEHVVRKVLLRAQYTNQS
jgi:hypothetical protein